MASKFLRQEKPKNEDLTRHSSHIHAQNTLISHSYALDEKKMEEFLNSVHDMMSGRLCC